jgi:hypothetical protein
MGFLKDVSFAVELDSSVPLKTKNALKSTIVAHGGKLAYIINKKVPCPPPPPRCLLGSFKHILTFR